MMFQYIISLFDPKCFVHKPKKDMGFFGPIQNNFGDTEGPNLLSGQTILDTSKPIWTGTAPEEMVQNVKLSSEKSFLVLSKIM